MDRENLPSFLLLKPEERPPEVEEAIERLHRERWTLYMRLVAPYFSAQPRPQLVAEWRAEASTSVARKLAIEDHDEAIEFMLGYMNGATTPPETTAATTGAQRPPAALR